MKEFGSEVSEFENANAFSQMIARANDSLRADIVSPGHTTSAQGMYHNEPPQVQMHRFDFKEHKIKKNISPFKNK